MASAGCVVFRRLTSCGGQINKQAASVVFSKVVRSYSQTQARPVGVWGAGFDQGQPHAGAGEAPRLLREAGLVERLAALGCPVTDHGDIMVVRGEDQSPAARQKEVAKFNQTTHNMVKQILDQGHVALTLGGDHSIGLGTVAGHLASDPECVVIWVDAHADINTMHTSNSGNMHGMPVSFNIQQLQEPFPHTELNWLTPRLAPSRLVYVGLRDVEEEEKKILADLDIAAFYMADVDKLGIVNVVKEALASVDPLEKRNIHLSFDIDALDPEDAPSTGTAVRGGLTLREGLTLCDMVHSTGRLRAVDLVEVNPTLGKDMKDVDRTVSAANNIILAAMGFRNSPPISNANGCG